MNNIKGIITGGLLFECGLLIISFIHKYFLSYLGESPEPIFNIFFTINLIVIVGIILLLLFVGGISIIMESIDKR